MQLMRACAVQKPPAHGASAELAASMPVAALRISRQAGFCPGCHPLHARPHQHTSPTGSGGDGAAAEGGAGARGSSSSRGDGSSRGGGGAAVQDGSSGAIASILRGRRGRRRKRGKGEGEGGDAGAAGGAGGAGRALLGTSLGVSKTLETALWTSDQAALPVRNYTHWYASDKSKSILRTDGVFGIGGSTRTHARTRMCRARLQDACMQGRTHNSARSKCGHACIDVQLQ